jgi:uncharacterized membrane protein
MRNVLLAVATGGTGLVAGLFLAFSIAVMPALAGTDARTFVTVMNRINVVIVNPLFLLLLFVSPILLFVATLLSGPKRGLVVVALVLNLVALVITMAVNVPLNNALANTGVDVDAARSVFERAWNIAHTVRTVLMAGTLATSVAALAARA